MVRTIRPLPVKNDKKVEKVHLVTITEGPLKGDCFFQMYPWSDGEKHTWWGVMHGDSIPVNLELAEGHWLSSAFGFPVVTFGSSYRGFSVEEALKNGAARMVA